MKSCEFRLFLSHTVIIIRGLKLSLSCRCHFSYEIDHLIKYVMNIESTTVQHLTQDHITNITQFRGILPTQWAPLTNNQPTSVTIIAYIISRIILLNDLH